MDEQTYLVTGATRGLGLSTVEALLRVAPRARVVLAVRDVEAGRQVAARLGERVEVVALDVGSQASVRGLVSGWTRPLAGLVNNAGLQITSGTTFTREGVEETFAVNHLGAFGLTAGLLPHLKGGGRVLFIGSGTHNPDNATARIFGFRGGRFTSVEALAKGEAERTGPRAQGLDRYATSKLLNTVSARAFQARVKPEETLFLTLDPGLMPGTGLARTWPAPLQLLWRTVMRWVAPLLFTDTSTTERSGEAAAWLLTEPSSELTPGGVYSFDRKPSRHVWRGVEDPRLADAVYEQTVSYLGRAAA